MDHTGGGATFFPSDGSPFYPIVPPTSEPDFFVVGRDGRPERIIPNDKKRKRPPPTGADPAPPEAIPDDSKAIAVCTAPDV